MTRPTKPAGSKMAIIAACESCNYQKKLYSGWLSKMPGGTWLLRKIAEAEPHSCNGP